MNSGCSEQPDTAPRGFLVIDKPSGITSRAAVNRVAKLLPKIKVGHAGTLDPLASGVLVMGIGKATRLIETVQNQPKSYRTIMRLGATSDTFDADGCILERIDPPVPSESEIQTALQPFSGEILQKPPGFSALKVNGLRAYEIARSGQIPALLPRPVQIYRCELKRYDWPRLEVEIDCGRGTYIRSIASDIGESLNCGAYVEVLVRTRIGPFQLEDALTLDNLTPASLIANLRSEVDALPDTPRMILTPEQVTEIAAGRRLMPSTQETPPIPGSIALLDNSGRLIALAEYDEDGFIQPRKVFH